jgi:hypothetical protein
VLYHALAPLLVASGDEAGYGQQCHKMLTRFGGVSDPVIAQLMAKACLIQRCASVDLNATDKLADIAAKGDPANVFFPWLQFAKGLNEYRHDRFGEAVVWMQKVLATAVPEPPSVPCRDVEAWMVLAMGQYQLKQVAEARVALAKGVAIEQTKLAKLADGDLGTDWGDWVTAQALMSEAKALIEGGAETNGEIKSAPSIASPSASPGKP